MTIRELRRLKREAFTLVELLVVMGIILVLISLTLAAVMKVLEKKPEVATHTEMSQLDGSIQTFMQKYGVEYIPSQIKLCQNANSYNTNIALDHDSVDFITKTIGKSSPGFWNPSGTGTWQTTGINWAGANTPAVEILEGEQCLVFFLGGIQSFSGGQYACNGFGPDAAHPDNLASSPANNIGPFFGFQPPRLFPPVGKQYCAYADPYGLRLVDGKPRFYAYFSCYKSDNGYNRYQSNGALATSPSSAVSDCASLQTPPVWPYASTPPTKTTPTVYVNSKSWQIICAGLDGTFGPGTDPTGATPPYYWNATSYAQIQPPGQAAGGADDQANFAFGKLQFGK